MFTICFLTTLIFIYEHKKIVSIRFLCTNSRLIYRESRKNILFFHGDLYFNDKALSNLNYKKSFLLIDSKNMMKPKEIGVTIQNNKATMLSYGLPTKWCQMAFITGKELKILKNILCKLQGSQKKLLSFEIINSPRTASPFFILSVFTLINSK